AEAHTSPNGPDDARPTALQILKDNALLGKLTDKTVLVTGGTSGIGTDTIRQLAKTGALWAEEAKIDADLKDAKIEWVKVDNLSLKSVKEGPEDFLRKADKLNVLVANADSVNTPYAKSAEGFEAQIRDEPSRALPALQLLRPLLLKSSTPSFNSRVVTVASTAHGFST
ncbi:hypothetical protein LTR17_027859, partial [Elasticomyces elasticus]